MERKKSALSGLFNAVNALENVLLAVMVIGMIVTILLQIGGRLIGHPFPWTEETSRYLFLWMMFVHWLQDLIRQSLHELPFYYRLVLSG